MPEWIHNRAEHLLAKNPSMSKSTAFAIATQQGHATGHTPKGYGTAEGRREAKAKFDTPKNDVQKANPGNLDSPKLKSASVGDALLRVMQTTGILEKLGFANSAYAGQPAQNGPGMKSHSQLPPFVAPPLEVKAAGVGVGAGMSTSQYSGPLSYGPFKQTSQIPGFVSPGMTKVDPSLEPGGVKAAAAATGAMSPAAKLSTSQRVGAPKTTGFSGPSIADIAKPKGYGTPLAGAGKNAI